MYVYEKNIISWGSVLFACMPWMLGMDRHGSGKLLQFEVQRHSILQLKGKQRGPKQDVTLEHAFAVIVKSHEKIPSSSTAFKWAEIECGT